MASTMLFKILSPHTSQISHLGHQPCRLHWIYWEWLIFLEWYMCFILIKFMYSITEIVMSSPSHIHFEACVSITSLFADEYTSSRTNWSAGGEFRVSVRQRDVAHVFLRFQHSRGVGGCHVGKQNRQNLEQFLCSCLCQGTVTLLLHFTTQLLYLWHFNS